MLQLNVHVRFDEMITTTLFFKSYQHSELDFYCVNSRRIPQHMIQHHYVLYNHIITTGVKLTCRNYNLLIVIELLIKF
jgi:hypothetical protein